MYSFIQVLAPSDPEGGSAVGLANLKVMKKRLLCCRLKVGLAKTAFGIQV